MGTAQNLLADIDGQSGTAQRLLNDLEARPRSTSPTPPQAPKRERLGTAQRLLRTIERGATNAADMVRGAPEAALQTLKDIPVAATAVVTGAATAIPKLVSLVPGPIGEGAERIVEAGDAVVEASAMTTGGNAESPGVKLAEFTGEMGADLILAGGISKAIKVGARSVPALRKFTQAADKARAARAIGKPVTGPARFAPLAENIIEGQIVGGLLTAGRRLEEGETQGERLAQGAAIGLGIDVVGAGIAGPGYRAAKWTLNKALETKLGSEIARNFRYLGNVSDDVRQVFDDFFLTRAKAASEGLEFAEEVTQLPMAARIRTGQKIRGSIGADMKRAEVTAAGRQAWSEIEEQIAKVNADTSVARDVRQKTVQDLRAQQRQVVDTMRGDAVNPYFVAAATDGYRSKIDLLRKTDELAIKARTLLEPESAAATARKAIPATVYHTKLTPQQIRERREAKLQARRDLRDLGLDVQAWRMAERRRELYADIARNQRQYDDGKTYSWDKTTNQRVEITGDEARLKLEYERQQTIAELERLDGQERQLDDVLRSMGETFDGVAERQGARILEKRAGVEVQDRALDDIRAQRKEAQEGLASAREDLKNAEKDLAELPANASRYKVKRREAIIASSKRQIEHFRNVSKLLDKERRSAEVMRDTLVEEVDRLTKVPNFEGRAERIAELTERINAANTSIKWSYKFGGTNYSPRMYLSKEEADTLQRYGIHRTGPKRDPRLRLGRTRTEPDGDELPPQVRQAMQEILDPSYPVAKKLQQLADDRAAFELGESLRKRADVVSATEQPGFVQITAGPLKDLYVHRDIAGEIEQIAGTKARGLRIYQALMGLWKTNKTALNPATHARNIFSNTVFMDFAGVAIHEQPAAYLEAIDDIRKGSGAWLEYRGTGQSLGTHAAADLEALTGVAFKPVKDGDEWFERLAMLPQKYQVTRDLIRLYQAEDDLARLVIFKKGRSAGLSVDEAAQYVDKFLPNYRKIPKNVLTSSIELYSPFFKFTWTAMPIMARNLLQQPVKAAKWFALGKFINDLSAQHLGISEEDQDSVRAVLPNYMQRGDVFAPSVLPLLPKLDENGQMLFLDASYFVPLNNMVDDSRSLMPVQALDPGNPLLRTVAEVWLNEQGYNGRPIYDEVVDVNHAASEKLGQTVLTPEGYAKVAGYLANQALPSIAGWGRKRIMRAITETPDYRGNVQGVGPAVADAIFGVKTRAIDPQQQKRARIAEIDEKIRAATAELKRSRKDASFTAAERNDKVEAAQDLIRQLRSKRRDVTRTDVSRK